MKDHTNFLAKKFYFPYYVQCAAAWNALTALQQAAWVARAGTLSYPQPSGPNLPPEPELLYIQANLLLAWAGKSLLTSPPVVVRPPNPVITSLLWTPGSPNITSVSFSNYASAFNTIIISCTPVMGYGSVRYKHLIEPIWYTNTPGIVNVNLEPLIIAKYGYPTGPTNMIWVSVCALRNSSGIRSYWYPLPFYFPPAP